MKLPGRFVTVGLVATLPPLLTSTLWAAQATDEDLVRQYFPMEVHGYTEEILERYGAELTELYHWRTSDLDGTGREDYVAAVYMNGFVAGFRLIRKEPDGESAVVGAPEGLAMEGRVGRVDLSDLDGDGRPEILVHLGVDRKDASWSEEQVWVFGWNGVSLKHLSPTGDSGQDALKTLFVRTTFEDIDGDGISEAITPIGNDNRADIVYRLMDGGYRDLGERRYSLGVFYSPSQPDQPHERELTIQDPDRAHYLLVGNYLTGNTRAEVRVNGEVVIAADQLVSGGVDQIVVPVTLRQENVIAVWFSGDRTGNLGASVRPVP